MHPTLILWLAIMLEKLFADLQGRQDDHVTSPRSRSCQQVMKRRARASCHFLSELSRLEEQLKRKADAEQIRDKLVTDGFEHPGQYPFNVRVF